MWTVTEPKVGSKWYVRYTRPNAEELVTDRYRSYFLASVETHDDGSRGWEHHQLDSDRRHYFLWTDIVSPTDKDWK